MRPSFSFRNEIDEAIKHIFHRLQEMDGSWKIRSQMYSDDEGDTLNYD